MRFQTKRYRHSLYKNTFLIFPKRMGEFTYWLCWVTTKHAWLGGYKKHSRFSEMVAVGKQADDYNTGKFDY